METVAKDVRKSKRKNAESLMHFIRRHRRAKGYSQTTLAAALKLKSPSTVSLWESGNRAPSDEVIPRLASILDIDALELTDMIEAEENRRLQPR